MDHRPATVSSIIYWAELGQPAFWSTDNEGVKVTWAVGREKVAVSINIPHWVPGVKRAYECFADGYEPFVTNSLDVAIAWLRRRAAENP